VGTSKILARYKGSTISLQSAVHLGHMPWALRTKKKSWDPMQTDDFELYVPGFLSFCETA
jgi:hypothetical protein